MATALSSIATLPDTEDQWYLWPSTVDWAFYQKILRLRGERSVPRMLYLDGSLLLMTPSFAHETIKERLGRFVTEVVAGLAIPCRPAGQTTLRRKVKHVGVEGDLTYYIANQARVRGKQKLDLRHDPPPDLAIEVVYAHAVTAALEVYRRLRVPEVWVAHEQKFEILSLQRTGRGYQFTPVEHSLSFPVLTAAEIAEWIGRSWDGDETQWVLDLRRWVQEVLVPRIAPREEGR